MYDWFCILYVLYILSKEDAKEVVRSTNKINNVPYSSKMFFAPSCSMKDLNCFLSSASASSSDGKVENSVILFVDFLFLF